MLLLKSSAKPKNITRKLAISKNGKITCRKNDGENKVEYLVVKMTDIMVSKVVWAGDGNDQSLNETLEISFAEFHLDYKVQNESGDAAQGSTSYGFNIQKQLGK